LYSPESEKLPNKRSSDQQERQHRVPTTRILNGQFDLNVRAPDRLRGAWECCGDIVDRERNRPIARVYGKGRTSAVAEEDVVREAERWISKASAGR